MVQIEWVEHKSMLSTKVGRDRRAIYRTTSLRLTLRTSWILLHLPLNSLIFLDSLTFAVPRFLKPSKPGPELRNCVGEVISLNTDTYFISLPSTVCFVGRSSESLLGPTVSRNFKSRIPRTPGP